MERLGEAVLAALIAVVFALHPWAASGAAFGCCVFMASPRSTTKSQRMLGAVGSWGMGYALGVFWFGAGPPWDVRAMLPAVAGAAFTIAIFTGFCHVFVNNGPLPTWLESILDRLPMLKGRRGSNDGT